VNPYTVLSVSVTADYHTVKKAFYQAALRHHPDTSDTASEEAHEQFVLIKTAFEEICCQRGFRGGNEEETADDSEEENFWHWYHESGHDTKSFLTFHMTHDQLREVIRVHQTMSHGGRDRGGYWEMARQLAERAEAAGDNDVPLSPSSLITAGEIPSTETTVLRRRRRR
jgi:hypothetical protein